MPDSKPDVPNTAAGYALLRNRGKTADALIGHADPRHRPPAGSWTRAAALAAGLPRHLV